MGGTRALAGRQCGRDESVVGKKSMAKHFGMDICDRHGYVHTACTCRYTSCCHAHPSRLHTPSPADVLWAGFLEIQRDMCNAYDDMDVYEAITMSFSYFTQVKTSNAKNNYFQTMYLKACGTCYVHAASAHKLIASCQSP